MNENKPHARTFDLPGWPCPPRVRDIPNLSNSWGRIPVARFAQGEPGSGSFLHGIPMGQDEHANLWVNGNVIPEFATPDESLANPGALVFWTETGIGLWVHPKSLNRVPSISHHETNLDEWLPVNEVVWQWPSFIKNTMMADAAVLWSDAEAAKHWGVSTSRARAILADRGIKRVSGYPAEQIKQVVLRQGARTDLTSATDQHAKDSDDVS